jgi:hypothetical protein
MPIVIRAVAVCVFIRPPPVYELFKIVLTACLTLIGGVLLLVITQVITRLVIDPLIEFRRLLGEIGHTLVFYSNYFYNASVMASTPEFADATRECRTLAARLRSFSNAVPLYSALSYFNLVPAHRDVYEASGYLIGLSNTKETHPMDVVQKHYERISKLLSIRVD